MNDPEHQEQRRLVSRRFTPRAIRGHESRVRHIVTGILNAVAPLGQCEAIEAIASRLPAIMISDLLGYPRELWERVRYWSEQTMLLSGQTSPQGPPHVLHPGIPPVMREFAETTIGLIQARRAEPRDDLISVWARTPGWDTKRILEETILVLDGGAETTRTVIGSMIRELALQPGQRQILAERRDRVEDRGHDVAHLALAVTHGPRGEPAGHQPALLLVARVVHVDHGHVLALVDQRARAFG